MICGGGQSAGFELLCLLLLLLYCISPTQSGLLLFIIFCLTMAKRPASSSVESQIKKRAKKGTTSSATPNLDNLHKTRDAGKKKHMFAEGTDGNYTGHLDRGSRFLASLVADKKNSAESSEEGFFDRDINPDEMAKAFDKIPNKYSAPMLELFLVQKCMTENCTQSTAHGIHAAFIRLWDQRQEAPALAIQFILKC